VDGRSRADLVKPRRVVPRAPVSAIAPRIDLLAWAIGSLAAIAPLWAGRNLPLVDLPQHLYVISVLHRLRDATTLYPLYFDLRQGPNPYFGYYYLVGLLHTLLPLELANRVFLSAYAAGLPLSLAFLLRSLKRPAWPALLAVPFAYGDGLAWGFINYCAALPLTFLSLGLCLRALTATARRALWAVLFTASLAAVLAMHIQPLAYLALALPFLLLTTPVPADRSPGSFGARLGSRWPVLLGLAPAALAGAGWLALRLRHPTEVAYGVPGKAWGPLLSWANLPYDPFADRLASLWQLPANLFQDGSDRWGLHVASALALFAVFIASLTARQRQHSAESWPERSRLVGLSALGFALVFAMPRDIRGYMYYVAPRFVLLAAPLLIVSVPRLPARPARAFLWLAAACAIVTAVPLCRGFAAFDREARSLAPLVAAAGERPMVMGLMFDPYSRVVAHPVYQHSAAVIARERGGVPDYSFILAPYSPVRFRVAAPPPLPYGEWEPSAFDYAAQGWAYDHFLVRGADPARVFGSRLGNELAIAARSGDFWLVRRKR